MCVYMCEHECDIAQGINDPLHGIEDTDPL